MPLTNWPKLVFRNVSSPASKSIKSRSIATTVKQQPFSAMLSPTCVPGLTSAQAQPNAHAWPRRLDLLNSPDRFNNSCKHA